MASTSGKQHRFMEMVAHDPKAAKRVGVPQSVGEDFAKADEGKGPKEYSHADAQAHAAALRGKR